MLEPRSSPRRPAPARRPRGNTLIVTVVIMAVLAVVAAGLTRRASREIENAGAKAHYDVAVTCVEGARNLLVSQIRAYGADPTQLVIDQAVAGQRLSSGHYDQFAVKSVELVPNVGSTGNVFDAANRSFSQGVPGRTYRINIVCSDSSGTRVSEVEFLTRVAL